SVQMVVLVLQGLEEVLSIRSFVEVSLASPRDEIHLGTDQLGSDVLVQVPIWYMGVETGRGGMGTGGQGNQSTLISLLLEALHYGFPGQGVTGDPYRPFKGLFPNGKGGGTGRRIGDPVGLVRGLLQSYMFEPGKVGDALPKIIGSGDMGDPHA